MEIKIWGARGSIPTPIRPEEVREKIISALLNVSKIEGEFRQMLTSAILEDTQSPPGQPSFLKIDTGNEKYQQERRRVIETYLDRLSPLSARTSSGNTPCIEVRAGKELFILDAGSGIRELGIELMKGECGQGKGVIHLLFSHPHWDHIQGFPFFRPAFVPGNKIFIYGVHDIEAALRRQQEFISFPIPLDYMQADREFIQLKPDDVLEFSDELRVRHILNHHPGDAYAFRFEKGDKAFVYASDSAYPTGIDLKPYLNFFKNADVLIFDAQFTQRESDEKEDWGHSSSFFGVEMAQEAKVKELVLFHYDPTYSDRDLEKILEDTLKFQYNQYPTRDPVKVAIAHEGQIFNLKPTQTTQLHHIPGGNIAILKPGGIFDESVAAQLSNELNMLRQQNRWTPQLIVDMSAVELLQVSGLRSLVKLRKEQQGIPMVLAGPSINVQQLIELAGYLDFFAIYPSVHAALNALKAHETLNLPGQMIKNRYSVKSKIGDGRLGTVFNATDTRLNRPIALKVLSPSFSEGAIEQFLSHARQIIDLSHPNIVGIYDCDADQGLSYMVEEFIEGKTLRDLIDDTPGPLPFDVALSIAEHIAQGLEYAHGHGVIHGDLKPKNVLLWKGQVKISDFGLGRLESGTKSLINIDMPLAVITARYVAPEQVLGHPIDARTDLYALGSILYELFTGHPLFQGTEKEVLQQQRDLQPRPPRALNSHLPGSLEHLILKLLDKDPNKRYARASQVRHILASVVTPIRGAFPREQWPALVGNDEILAQLNYLWSETEQGRGQLVFLSGESGLGKTRLTQEFSHRVDPATLLIGKCRKFGDGPAYQPFVEALTAYFSGTSPEIAQQQVGHVLQELAQTIPQVQQVLAQVNGGSADKLRPTPTAVAASGLNNAGSNTSQIEGDPASSEMQTEALMASFAELIKTATDKLPWLIIIDDLHWANHSTLRLFYYLAQHSRDLRLMIVGTYQESRVAANPFLVEMLDLIEPELPHTSLSLAPMTAAEIKQLLENFWLQAVPNDLATATYLRTQGNPLFAEEIAKGLVADHIVTWRNNKWHFASVLEAALPQDVHDAILRRINRLSKETQTLLQQAATLGRTFSFADLHEMSDLSEWDALESLDIALEEHLVIELPGEEVLRFKHAEIQRVLYQNLGDLKRRLMHGEAGEALERRVARAGHPADVSDALAYHFYQAEEFAKAFAYAVDAAEHAKAAYAGQIALTWYKQALQALDHFPQDNDALPLKRFDTLLAREQVYDYLGYHQDQADDLATLQSLAQTLDDPLKQGRVQLRQAAFQRSIGQLDQATLAAEATVRIARQDKAAFLEGEGLLQLAYIQVGQERYEAALETCADAQKILTEVYSGQPPQAGILYTVLGNIYTAFQDYDQAKAYYDQALAVSRARGRWFDFAATLNQLSALYLRQERYDEAQSVCHRALELNRLMGHRRNQTVSLQNLALTYKALGRDKMAQRYLEQSPQPVELLL